MRDKIKCSFASLNASYIVLVLEQKAMVPAPKLGEGVSPAPFPTLRLQTTVRLRDWFLHFRSH